MESSTGLKVTPGNDVQQAFSPEAKSYCYIMIDGLEEECSIHEPIIINDMNV
jgi:hypothetical protein